MLYSARKPPLLYVLASLALVVACLYWARMVMIPVALAILLTFLLHPIVDALQNRRIPRVPAAILVVILAFSLMGGIGWIVARQVTMLANELPQHTDNLKRKIADLRGISKGGVIAKLQQTVQELLEELYKGEAPPRENPSEPTLEKPVPVVVQPPSVLWQLPSLLEPLASAGLVIVLVMFMLIQYTDLRHRLIRLAGYGRLPIATKALDEVGQRISRYLLVQSIINGSFGSAVGLGLFFIGVPYATLWGFLAAVLRFIPYVGPTVAAILPSALSLAVFPGWLQPVLVVGLILVVELVTNSVMEPRLYGQTAGVSEVALMVAIAFWTWLWGPVGLLLATPMTVCLAVLGKYVPQLEFIGILMGDEPALETHARYYQRLLAKDHDEAAKIVEEYAKTHTLEEVYDDILVPALTAAKQDREQDSLEPEDMHFIMQATRAIIDDLAMHQSQTSPPVAMASGPAVDEAGTVTQPKIRIVGCPAHDEADELALLMLRQLLDPTRYELEIASAEMLTGEVVSLVEQQHVGLICIAALPPEAMAPIRYLCKRLRARFPELKIVIGRWGFTGDSEANRALLLSGCIDEVGMTLSESRNQVMQLSELSLSHDPQAATTSAAERVPPEASTAPR
jgi:predicted PurR-regulated permease PerM